MKATVFKVYLIITWRMDVMPVHLETGKEDISAQPLSELSYARGFEWKSQKQNKAGTLALGNVDQKSCLVYLAEYTTYISIFVLWIESKCSVDVQSKLDGERAQPQSS